ncbi:MarR family winged helix-turn-helix transcriptional regulator [Streptomyces liangshanensis]|uniref:MarR family winged helix-turn-helix transcriptional regulator n=1 Tax=Streptomyces liangshanensis TaxID=2717324 RepID=UPI0036D76FD6
MDDASQGQDGQGGTRWLDGHQLSAWKAFSGMLLKLPAALDSQLTQDAGLNQFEYVVLAALSESENRTRRMSTLAILANGSLSRLSHVVKRLEKRGYLRREPCAADGRYTNAVLTDAGWDKVVATAPGHVEAVRSLVVDALEPEQLDQLRDISHRLLHALDPDLGCPSGGTPATPARGPEDTGPRTGPAAPH